mmetsp:Transcript_13571/g.34498  ORF Transcript_13571/g.34498 Transcript_13571/m.34498 type:complete len:226 (+) Transcript_13571:517-1194(+)
MTAMVCLTTPPRRSGSSESLSMYLRARRMKARAYLRRLLVSGTSDGKSPRSSSSGSMASWRCSCGKSRLSPASSDEAPPTRPMVWMKGFQPRRGGMVPMRPPVCVAMSVSEAKREGAMRASSCATIPPMENPIRWTPLAQPSPSPSRRECSSWMRSCRKSDASAVEVQRPPGVSDRPTPRLSATHTVNWSARRMPKYSSCGSNCAWVPPRPMSSSILRGPRPWIS